MGNRSVAYNKSQWMSERKIPSGRSVTPPLGVKNVKIPENSEKNSGMVLGTLRTLTNIFRNLKIF